jgi:ABC-type polysaccharide/polyol phosphate transport system ATPase subunit
MASGSIEVIDVHKTFRLPHQPRMTIKAHLLNPFDRMTYEQQNALQGVTFDVRPGEFFGIIGANGSGKSTLLKIIAGIYHPNRGRVRVEGLLSPFIELGVGFNPELSARDNVRINGTLLGLSRSELNRRFDDIIAFAELESFVDQKLKNYSSGMQLRLAFSIAIQVDFEILLLDEVLAVGDQDFQQKCFATFDRFRDEGKTIVFVSHDLATMGRFCNRVALLERGRLRACGEPSAVIATYVAHAV